MMDDLAYVASVTNAIAEFEIYTRHGMLDGKLRISSLHRIYQRIQPVLHPLVSNPKVIDLGALGYALSRLPQNICTVSRVRLKRSVPKDFEKWNGVKPVATDVWGRPTFDIGDGEIVIVIQEDTGEVLDILSLLCALTVEAKKVRAKLVAAGLDKILAEYASDGTESTTFGFKLKAAALPNAKKNQLFASLAFELGTNIEVLLRLDEEWRGQLIQKMYEIATWDSDIWVMFHTSIAKGTYQFRINEWCRDIVQELENLGLAGRPLHVISTEPESLEDVLLSADRIAELQRQLRLTRSETLKRVTREMADHEGEELPEPDHSYLLLRSLTSEERNRRREETKLPGFHEVEDRHQIGLRCRIIDVAHLDLTKVDPRLALDADAAGREPPVILNFGRAFGGQGGKIFAALASALPGKLRSYSVVFTAGALEGGTGTIVIPSYVIKDGSQDAIDFLTGNAFDPKWLDGLTKDPVLADGPVVTVLGIVLQSRRQLQHYNRLWKAIGVDTVAAAYANTLNGALLSRQLAPDFQFRLAYVCTDNPIHETETLAHNVRYEGVRPHNAISVALLGAILKG